METTQQLNAITVRQLHVADTDVVITFANQVEGFGNVLGGRYLESFAGQKFRQRFTDDVLVFDDQD